MNFGSQQFATAAFQTFDRNDNGTVLANEWRHVMSSLGDRLNQGNRFWLFLLQLQMNWKI